MSQIRNIATELLAWGDQTAFLYRTTNELVYTNLSGHLHLLSAYMYRLADSPEGVSSFNTRVGDVVLLYADVIDALGFVPLSGMPTLAQVTTAGNTTTNAITVGGLTVDTNTLVVDSVNNSVGIGTTSPLAKLHIATNTGGTNTVLRLSVAPSSANVIHFRDTDGTSQGAFLATGSTFSYGTYQAAQVNLAGGLGGIGLRTNNGNAHIRFYSGNADEDFSPEIARFVASTGNLLLNTTTDAGYKLDVVGVDSRFNGVRVGLGAGNINDNIVIGSGFSANTTGDRSVVMGYGALAVMSTVSRSTAVGYRVGANSTIEITAFGYRALFANTTGTSNTAFGNAALEANTTGAHNTAFGYSTLSQNTTGTRNIAVGNYALAYKNVSDSIAIGFETIAFGAGSSTNIAIGSFTMRTVTGSNNVGIGYGILYNTSGSNNASFGTSSLYSNTTGSNNTALGYQAGYSGTTGANNIFIGYQSTGVLATDSNRTWIGNSSTTSTWIGGNLLVGTTTDAGYKLDVNGNIRAVLANTTTANVIYYDSSTGLMTYGAAPSGGGTPTLATVTTAGNTTTNSISVGGLTVVNGAAPIAVFNSSNVGHANMIVYRPLRYYLVD